MSNPVKPADAGLNRTGIATSPFDSKDIAAAAKTAPTTPSFELEELSAVRLSYSREAPPVGTMPPPGSLKGAVKAAAKALQGKHPMVFLDLLGERLAFERTGARLYDALLIKLEAAGNHAGGPTREQLESIRDDELAHFGLLKQAIEDLGGDPTAMTPSADLAAVASKGIVAVVSDARVTLAEALKAILVAELADNDGWLTLADVAERIGQEDLAAAFRNALAVEEEHLMRVRAWVATSLEAMAGLEPRIPGDGGDAEEDLPTSH
jgi:rubrerythrin